MDDATGTVLDARFSAREDARSYFLLTERLVRCRGIPLALYTDRHGVFRHTPGAGATGTATQFSRAMDELGVQMIFAQSPQAKGRVERTAGTFRDRLVTELRLAAATTIAAANAVLQEFLPRFNRSFSTYRPQCAETAFRSLDPELCLEQILCFKHKQTRGQRQHGKVPVAYPAVAARAPNSPAMPGQVVEVLERLDGQLYMVRHEGRIVTTQEAPPSPVFLRNGHGRSASATVPPSGT